MGLKFIAIDPDTNGDHCPAVFIEEETGDLLFPGLDRHPPRDARGGRRPQPDRG